MPRPLSKKYDWVGAFPARFKPRDLCKPWQQNWTVHIYGRPVLSRGLKHQNNTVHNMFASACVFHATFFVLATHIQLLVGLNEKFTLEGNGIVKSAANNHDFEDFQKPIFGKSVVKRNALKNKARLWAGAIVPYVLDRTSFTENQVRNIEKAIEEFHKKTCVHFIRKTTEDKYVFITRALGTCSSPMGAPLRAGMTQLYLSTECLQVGTVIHELMHTIGFYHEHNRPDRDQYVRIEWENIPSEKQHNFYLEDDVNLDTLQVPYDYTSIMHYNVYSFAKDYTKPTISIMRNMRLPILIGQRFSLSELDVRKVKILYGCENKPSVADSIIFPTDVQEYTPLIFRYKWDYKANSVARKQ